MTISGGFFWIQALSKNHRISLTNCMGIKKSHLSGIQITCTPAHFGSLRVKVIRSEPFDLSKSRLVNIIILTVWVICNEKYQSPLYLYKVENFVAIYGPRLGPLPFIIPIFISFLRFESDIFESTCLQLWTHAPSLLPLLIREAEKKVLSVTLDNTGMYSSLVSRLFPFSLTYG